jgi:hypothetical protein
VHENRSWYMCPVLNKRFDFADWNANLIRETQRTNFHYSIAAYIYIYNPPKSAWCTARTFNSYYFVGLGAPHGYESISGYYSLQIAIILGSSCNSYISVVVGLITCQKKNLTDSATLWHYCGVCIYIWSENDSDSQSSERFVHWSYSSGNITLLAELPNTGHSYSRHGVVTAWLTSERPGSVIPVSKTLTLLLGVHS